MSHQHGISLARPSVCGLLLAALALSACVSAGPGTSAPAVQGAASPTRVVMYRDTITVEMRDKSLCTGPRRAAGTSWTGTLAGCPHQWPYEVRQPQGRFVRLPLQPGEGGAGQVSLTPPSGAAQIWSTPRLAVGG